VASDHIFDHGYVDMCAKEDNDENDNPFSKLGLDRNIVRTISNPDGYFKLSQLTIIQFRAIKALLPSDIGSMKAKRAKHNLFIQSETGSGKTLAYLLPILQVSHSMCITQISKFPFTLFAKSCPMYIRPVAPSS